MERSFTLPTGKTIVKFFLLFAVYFISAKLGLKLAYVHSSATAVWPPTGIALAAFLIWGDEVWPVIFLGALIVNLTTAGSFWTCLGIACGNTLEAWVGALLVRRFANGSRAFERAGDILKFVFLAEILSTALSPTFGVASLCLGHTASWSQFSSIWTTWWLGDLSGALIAAPLLLLVWNQPRWDIRQVPEILITLGGVALTAQIVFGPWFAAPGQNLPVEFFCIPPLIWTAYRFGPRETAAAICTLCGVALIHTLNAHGPFTRTNPNESLLLLQAFMAVASITSLTLAAAITERKMAEEGMQRAKRAEKALQEKIALVELLQSIAVAANESASLEEAVQTTLDMICRYTGWPVGHAYYLEEGSESRLKPGLQWRLKDPEKYQRFKEITEKTFLESGQGLPGMVLLTRAPYWIEDVTRHPNFPRAKAAVDIGVRAGFGFPVLSHKKVMAILEFFFDQPVSANEEWLENMAHVGVQLGRVSERHQAKEDQSRLALLVETSSDFIVTVTPEGKVLYLNEAGRKMVGLENHPDIHSLTHDDFIFPEDIHRLHNEVIQALLTQGHWEGEFRLKNFKTLRPIPVYFSAGVLKDPATGQISTLAAIGHNITEKNLTEEALLNSEKHFRSLIENALDIVTILNEKGVILFESPSIEPVLGYGQNDLIGVSAFSLIHPDDLDRVRITFAALLQNPSQTQSVRFRFLHQTGYWRDLESVGKNLLGEPAVQGIVVNSRDITERQIAQQSLRESEERFRKLSEATLEGVLISEQGQVITANLTFAVMFGYRLEELSGKESIDFVAPENRDLAQNHIASNYEKTYEIKGLRKDGSTFPMEVTGKSIPFEGRIARVTTLRDVTERKKAEKDLREQAELLKSIVDNMGEGLLVCDEKGKTLFYNSATETMLKGEIGDPISGDGKRKNTVFKMDRITPLSAEELPITKTLQGESSDNVELFIQNPKKPEGLYIQATSRPIRDSEGKIRGGVSVFRDVTEQKKIFQILAESEERFRSVIQSSPNAIIVSDSRGLTLSWNNGAAKIFGYEEKEMLGEPLSRIIPQKYRKPHQEGMTRLQLTGESRLIGRTVEVQGLRKDGVEFPIELTLSSWKSGDNVYFGGIIRDITERKRVEELMRSNTELQQFANVASHDLQEPLRMVASYVQLLADHCKGQLDAEALEFIGYAVDGAKRMQQLINALLDYSRVESQGKPPQPVDFNKTFEQTVSNLEIKIEETGAKIDRGPLPNVMGDPVQLIQLLQNLFSNAIKFCKNQKPEIQFKAEEKEREWVFSCRDNGIGIDPKYFDRIFVIFQRLHHRSEYEGTGIGLAICKRIVERHGGRIWVQSHPGEGCTFFFALPKKE